MDRVPCMLVFVLRDDGDDGGVCVGEGPGNWWIFRDCGFCGSKSSWFHFTERIV